MSFNRRAHFVILVFVGFFTENCHSIKIIRVNEGLTEVPTDISTNVTHLDLTDNAITKLRDCQFCQYTQLWILDLKRNQIREISSFAFRNTVLDFLGLRENKLAAVPDLHIITQTLSRLSLQFNKLTEFNGKVCTRQLKKLKLDHNPISYIDPAAFDNCTALEHLQLSYNNLITLSVTHTEALKSIKVEGNSLSCDSRLQWLRDAAESGVDVSDFTCASPLNLECRLFSNLTGEELNSDDLLFDGNYSTCVTTAQSDSRFYEKWLLFSNCFVSLEKLPVFIVGGHLQCAGDNGLQMYIQMTPSPGTDMCNIGQHLKSCSLEEDSPTGCKFLCQCPVPDWHCKVGLLHWNRWDLPTSVSPGQICEVETY